MVLFTLPKPIWAVIPVFLTNMFIDKGPIQTIEKMREMLKLPKYRDAKVSYIEELEDESRSDF